MSGSLLRLHSRSYTLKLRCKGSRLVIKVPSRTDLQDTNSSKITRNSLMEFTLSESYVLVFIKLSFLFVRDEEILNRKFSNFNKILYKNIVLTRSKVCTLYRRRTKRLLHSSQFINNLELNTYRYTFPSTSCAISPFSTDGSHLKVKLTFGKQSTSED